MQYKRRKVIFTTYSNKAKYPSGTIIIAVLIAAYLIFASTTSVQADPQPCEKCSDFDNNGITDVCDLEEFVANWLWEEPNNAADFIVGVFSG